MSELKPHPLAEIFPPLDEGQLQELAADIRKNGLRQTIVTHQGQVLDGRNRLAACKIAEVEPRFKEFAGDDPLGYVISLNLKRRHLDERQRAMVAAKIATISHNGDRSKSPIGDLKQDERKSASPIGEPSQAQAAKMLNVGKRSVERARKVIEKADPKLVADVEKGKVSVSAAAKTVQSDAAQAAARAAGKYMPRPAEPATAPKVGGNLRLDLMAHKATLSIRTLAFQPSWPPLRRPWTLSRSTCRRA